MNYSVQKENHDSTTYKNLYHTKLYNSTQYNKLHHTTPRYIWKTIRRQIKSHQNTISTLTIPQHTPLHLTSIKHIFLHTIPQYTTLNHTTSDFLPSHTRTQHNRSQKTSPKILSSHETSPYYIKIPLVSKNHSIHTLTFSKPWHGRVNWQKR